MKYIMVSGLSRGGSNLVAALLHNNRDVYCIARREWNSHYNKGKIDVKPLMKLCRESKKSIYYSGGFGKNWDSISHLAFDKVMEKRQVHRMKGDVFVVSVIRNPFAIVNSMHRFAKKYKWKGWLQNEKTVRDFFRNRFVPLIRFVENKETDKLCLYFDDIVQRPMDVSVKMQEYCGLPVAPHTGFRDVFDEFGCVYCGGQFSNRVTGCSSASTVLTERGLKFPEREHFYCERCDVFTLGYGGFNPYSEISSPKDWQDDIPKELKNAIFSQLEKLLGKELAKRFSDNSFSLECLL